MEGEGDDELWVDSTQQTAPNAKCPISGRALLDLVEPVKRAPAASAQAARVARRRMTLARLLARLQGQAWLRV